MTYADIAVVQDILAFRILIEKVVGSLRGSGPMDADVVNRLVVRLSNAPSARRSFSRRIHPEIGGIDRLRTAFSASDDGGRADSAKTSDLEDEAVPLLREFILRKLDETEVNKLVGLLSKVDQGLDRDRTRAARSRYL